MRAIHAELVETVSGASYRVWVTHHGPKGEVTETEFAPYSREFFLVDSAQPTKDLVTQLGQLVVRSAGQFRDR